MGYHSLSPTIISLKSSISRSVVHWSSFCDTLDKGIRQITKPPPRCVQTIPSSSQAQAGPAG